mgnify:CR=1 FL=1
MDPDIVASNRQDSGRDGLGLVAWIAGIRYLCLIGRVEIKMTIVARRYVPEIDFDSVRRRQIEPIEILVVTRPIDQGAIGLIRSQGTPGLSNGVVGLVRIARNRCGRRRGKETNDERQVSRARWRARRCG